MEYLVCTTEDHSEDLSCLAYNSEAYWGFNDDYLKNFKTNYNVTKEFIKNNNVYHLANDNDIIGFFALQKKRNYYELGFFYINVKFIKKGYGKKLWIHLLDKCKELCIPEFILIAGPEVVPFYIKMGATELKKTDSLLSKNRVISVLKYKL